MSNKPTLQRVAFCSWEHVATKITITENDYFQMRLWQERMYGQLFNKKRRIINAPMGSGKSFGAACLSVSELQKNPKQKAIITTPQKIIGPSFRDIVGIEFPDGSQQAWNIANQNDLLSMEGKITERGMVDRLITFLKNPVNSKYLPNRVLLCSHQTWVRAYQRLQRNGQLSLLDNLSLYVDEAHKLKNALYEEENLGLKQNEIGKSICGVHEAKNTSITLMTATFFRGDRLALLPDYLKTEFDKNRFDLPYDEYLSSMEHLKSFSIDFLLYSQNPVEAIKLLFKEKVGKTLIHLPYVGSKYANGNKHKQVEQIIDAIKDNCSTITEDDDGVIYVKRDGQEIAIVDLVDDSSVREKRRRYIEKHSKSADGPDVIIALGMFKEGANYDYIDRSIIIGPRNSLTEMIQIIGRGFRDAEGKEHLSIYQLLPKTFQTTDEGFKDWLNDYMKAILASMILIDVLIPKKIKKGNKTGATGPRETREGQGFQDLPIDEAKRQSIGEQVLKDILVYRGVYGVNGSRDKFNEIVEDALADNKVECSYVDAVADDMWQMIQRLIRAMQGVDVSNIDMDIVEQDDPLGHFLKFISKVCGINTFKKLRDVLSKYKNTDKWIVIAEDLAAQNHGVLPHATHLIQNGYHGLYECMRQNPQPFEHIDQEKRGSAKPFVLFEKFVAYCRQNNIKSSKHFKKIKHPDCIPCAPDAYYIQEWTSWGEVLGTGFIAVGKRIYRSFKQARTFARQLGLKNREEWLIYTKSGNKPTDIPAYPESVYDEWNGMEDWLGYTRILPFHEAKAILQSLDLENSIEWKQLWKSGKSPQGIPVNLQQTYGKHPEWTGTADFLGSGRKLWSLSDKNFIRQNYLKMNDSELADHLSTTCSAIQTQRLMMGLKRRNDRYTEIEDNMIKTMYSNGHSTISIAKEIKRTNITGVRKRIRALGLR